MNTARARKPNILITRPEPQGSELGERLAKHISCTPTVLPLISFEPGQPCMESLSGITEISTIVTISPRSVSYGLPWLAEAIKPSKFSVFQKSINWYAMGPETDYQLKKAGIITTNKPRVGINSERLLADPLFIEKISQGSCLILKGEGGRDKLRQALIQQGSKVLEASVYKRVLPFYTEAHLASVFSTQFDCFSVTSGELLEHLVAVLENFSSQDWTQVPVLVVGARQASKARNLGFSTVLEASAADNETLLQAFSDMFCEQS